MEALFNVFFSLVELLFALRSLLISLVQVVIPWLPLLAWIGYWSLGVNWSRAFPVIRRGGVLGILLLMLVSVLVWGAVSPPEGGSHYFLGLTVSNYTGKFIYVTLLTCIALLCGSAQLSGSFGRFASFAELPVDEDQHDSAHAH